MWYLALYLIIVWLLAAPIFVYGLFFRRQGVRRFTSLFVSAYCLAVLIVYFAFFGNLGSIAALIVLSFVPMFLIVYRSFKTNDLNK